MGASQSVQEKTADVTNTKRTTSEDIKKALTTGNQMFLEHDIRDKILEVAGVMKSYSKSDYKSLLGEVDRLNEVLKAKGEPQLEISDQIKSSLMEFHKAILSKIESDNKTTFANKEDKERRLTEYLQSSNSRKYDETLNKMYKDGKENVEEIFTSLQEYYGSDMQESLNKILESPGITANEKMKTGLTSITSSIQNLKVKYRFFEYKYIQLNIFLILFIQKSYSSIDEFVTNVLAFNKQRDEIREKVISDLLDAMIKIMGAADLQLKTDDFNHLNKLLGDLSESMRKKEEDLQKKIKMTEDVTKENLKGFVDAITDATAVDLKKLLDSKYSTRDTRNSSTQNGGFIRGSSMMPQAFYSLDNPTSTEGTFPDPGAK